VCQFGDRVSNRVGRIAPRPAVDRTAKLHIAYRDFSPMMAWKSVTIEQIWKPETQSWAFENRWEY